MKKEWWYVYKSVFSFIGFSFLVLGIVNFTSSLTGITGFAIIPGQDNAVPGIAGIFFIILGLFFLSKTKQRKKGNSAIEFLLTYGWAILAAVITTGLLIYLGLIGNTTSYSPSASLVSGPFVLDGVRVTTSGVFLEMTNTNGPLTIYEVALNNLPSEVSCVPFQEQLGVEEGEQFMIVIPCSGLEAGAQFKANIDIVYNKEGSLIDSLSTGLITDTVQSVGPACSDEIDNDNDGWLDLDDPGCQDASDESEENGNTGFDCSDGIDNDMDGFKDGYDTSCPTWDFAFGESLCSNGIDDDIDGWIDYDGANVTYADPGCESPGSEEEFFIGATECSDQQDNDGDGMKDGLDPECSCEGPEKDSESTACVPGGGINQDSSAGNEADS